MKLRQIINLILRKKNIEQQNNLDCLDFNVSPVDKFAQNNDDGINFEFDNNSPIPNENGIGQQNEGVLMIFLIKMKLCLGRMKQKIKKKKKNYENEYDQDNQDQDYDDNEYDSGEMKYQNAIYSNEDDYNDDDQENKKNIQQRSKFYKN